MRNLFKIAAAIGVWFVLLLPAVASAVTISGYTFDSNSANLTNQWYKLETIFNLVDSANGHQSITYKIDEETVYGVKCAKVVRSNNSSDYFWLAQDTSGNIHLFKGRSAGYQYFQVTADSDIPNVWLSASPSTGDPSISYMTDGQSTYHTIAATGQTFGQYAGCIELRRIRADGAQWDIFGHPGTGIVGLNYRAPSSSEVRTYERQMDNSSQAPNPPAIVPQDWVGAIFATYSGGVDLWHDIYVIDHDGMPYLGSHYVAATFPDGTKWNVPPHDWENRGVEFYVSHSASDFYSGTYTYYAYDTAGNRSGPLVDEATYDSVPLVDSNSISIPTGTTAPKVSWQAVADVRGDRAGTVAYYRVIFDRVSDNERVNACYSTGTSCQVPPGVLDANTEYKVRIEARQEHDTIERDHISRSDEVYYTTGSTVPEDPFTDVSIWARGVRTVNQPRDGSPYVHMYVRVYDAQGVPSNIDSVTVDVPGVGTLPMFYQEQTSSTQGRYRTNYYASMPAGTYTFTIKDKDGHVFTTNQSFTPNPISPVPISSLRPLTNSVVSGDSVTLSWTPVSGAAYYSMEFYNQNGEWQDAYGILQSSSPKVTVGKGLLKKGDQYHWMVYALDNYSELVPQNISAADWDDFGPTVMSERTAGTNRPSISLAHWGTHVTTHENQFDTDTTAYSLGQYAEVTDADGAPGNIAKVTVTYPNGTVKNLYIDSVISDTTAGYYLEDPSVDSVSGMQSGNYVYKVTDNEGNTATVTDSFTPNPLDRIDNYGPETGSTLPLNGITLSTSAVPDAVKYRYRLRGRWISGWGYTSDYVARTSFTIPSHDNVVEDWLYRYRIEAFREDWDTTDIDNRSISRYSWANMDWFRTTANAGSSSRTLGFGAGQGTSDYIIAAVPLNPADPSPTAVLGISSADYDPTEMRLGRWNPASGTYDEYPDFDPLGPGDAFWALFRQSRSVSLNGTAPATVTHPTQTSQQAYQRSISNGWNMVGNPFTYTIGVADMVVSDNPGQYYKVSDGTITQSVFWVYNNGAYQATSTLPAGRGGWIKKTSAGTGSLYLAAIQRSADVRAMPVADDLERPPEPPGGFGETMSVSDGGGGGGGCFVRMAD